MKRILAICLLLPFLCWGQTGTISTIAGTGAAGYTGDSGPATAARLQYPAATVTDILGNLYISDDSNHCIRQITPAGVITTFAGTGTAGFSGDGGAATAARLNSPTGLACDAIGNLYIADRLNNRIRKVTAGGIIVTIAGSGSAGYSGDSGPATSARLFQPTSVALGIGSELYISDAGNNRVRKVNASGIISTFAGDGTAGYTGDYGVATGARLNQPAGLAVDAAGVLYLTDQGNNCIRKINSFGIINTIAGTGAAGFSGDGGAATAALLSAPTGIAVDSLGNVWLADRNNNRVRKIDASGNINTVAGTGTAGYSGDGGTATAALLNMPVGVFIDATGNALITEADGHRVRFVLANHAPYFTRGATATLTVCENTTAGLCDSLLSVNDSDAGQSLTWTLLDGPLHGSVAGAGAMASSGVGSLPSGLSYAPTMAFHGLDTMHIRVSDGLSSDTLQISILVNPLPVGGYVVGADSICPSGYETLSNATGSTGGTWRHSGSFITLDSVTGLLTGITPGTEIVTYSVTNSCGTATATLSLTVNDAPISGAIYGTDSVCVGATVLLFDTSGTPGGVWSADDTTIATVSATGIVTGRMGGVTGIYYNAYTHCGSAPAYHLISVNPNPGRITGRDTLCPGDTMHLGNVVTTGTWTSSATSTCSVTSTGVVTANTSGTAVISYSVSTPACGTGVTTRPVVVRSRPSAGSISGSAALCAGTSDTFTTTVSGGIWSSATPAVVTVFATTGVFTGVAVGSAVISYAITNACGTAYTTATLSVIGLPAPPLITGPDSVCTGATITVTGAPAIGTWTLSNGCASASGSGGSRSILGVTTGQDTLTYTVTNTCGSTAVARDIHVLGLLSAGVVSGPTSVCEGATSSLSSSASGGTWSSRSSALAAVSASGVVSGLLAGVDTIVYSVTNLCGTASAIHPLSVLPLPSRVTISGTDSICPSASVTLVVSAAGGTWSSGGRHCTVSGIGIASGTTPGDDTVFYALSNSCGSATAHFITTTIGAPVVVAITGPAAICTGSSVALSDSTAGGVWRASSASIATVNAASGRVTGLSSGTDTITYSVANACSTSTVPHIISVLPLPSAGTITGPGSLCPLAAVRYTGSETGGAWLLTNGRATFSFDSLGANVTAVSTGTDTLLHILTNSCGSDTAHIEVHILGLPVTAPITGPSSVCIGATIALADTTPGGVWTASNGHATVTTGSVLGVSSGIDTVLYTVTSVCGSTSSRAVIDVMAPVSPSVTYTASPDSSFCDGAVVTCTAVPVHGGSSPIYLWKRGATLVGRGATYTYAPTNGDVITCVMVSNEQCITTDTVIGNSIRFSVSPEVIPEASISASPSDTITHPGQLITVTANLTLCGTAPLYQWFLNGTAIAGATDATWTLTAETRDTVYCIVSCNIPCAASPFNRTNSVIIIPGYLGIADIAHSIPDVSVYPNPTDGHFVIRLNKRATASHFMICTVMSAAGKVVYQATCTLGNNGLYSNISLPEQLPAGLYILRISDENSVYCTRITKIDAGH